jgi:hypothetical protein
MAELSELSKWRIGRLCRVDFIGRTAAATLGWEIGLVVRFERGRADGDECRSMPSLPGLDPWLCLPGTSVPGS